MSLGLGAAEHQHFGLQVCLDQEYPRAQAQELAQNILFEMVWDATPLAVDIKDLQVQLGEMSVGEDGYVWQGQVALHLDLDQRLADYSERLADWLADQEAWVEELNAYLRQHEDRVLWAHLDQLQEGQ